MTPNDYYQPATVAEALALIDRYGDSLLILAGGTLAMPLINEGISNPEWVLSLSRTGLDTIQESADHVVLGAAVTMSQVIEWGQIHMLRDAAAQIGGWAVRNMATVGGNLFAPAPAGDFAVALLALGAQVKLESSAGARMLPLDDFYQGFMATALSRGELVTELHVPRPVGKTAYAKFGRKHANTPAVVTVAVQIVEAEGGVADAIIALNGVGSHPFKASAAQDQLIGRPLTRAAIEEASAAAAQSAQPFSDSLASDWYRLRMTEVLTRRTLLTLLDEEVDS